MARVHVLNTGGTLGMVGHPLQPAKSAEELLEGIAMPPDIELTLEDFPLRQDSTNVSHRERVEMARIIADVYDKHDAFVILHGTDSLAETAAALCMVFKQSMQKPVFVIGAQMTKDEVGTDVPMQLGNTMRVASSFVKHQRVGVYNVCMSNVWDGSRLKKQKDSDFDFIDTPGRHPVAKAWPHVTFLEGLRERDPVLAIQGLRLDTKFERRVFSTIQARMDSNPEALITLVDLQKYKGVILECKGAGQLSDKPWVDEDDIPTISWVDAIRYATDKGVYVGILSPFQDGRVILDRYELGQKVKDAGGLSLESLTPDMGDIKFRWALALYPGDRQRIQEFLSTNITGELLPGLEG